MGIRVVDLLIIIRARWDLCVNLKGQERLFFFFRHKSTYVIIVWAMWDLDVDPKGQESFYFSEICQFMMINLHFLAQVVSDHR